MSLINNFANGTVISDAIYDQQTCQEIYQRFGAEQSLLPVIYEGLQVTAATGLDVNVASGSARGQDLIFSAITGAPTLPTRVDLPATVVTCPDNTSGYIVLNVNIDPIPSVSGVQYTIEADDNGGPPAITPVFVTTLQPGVGAVYPFTQVVLAAVTTLSGAVTVINMTGLATVGGNRSFDYQTPIYVNGAFSFIAPAVASALTRKDYVDGTNVFGNPSTTVLPGGLIIKTGTVAASVTNGADIGTDATVNTGAAGVSFAAAFPTACMSVSLTMIQNPVPGAEYGDMSFTSGLSAAGFTVQAQFLAGYHVGPSQSAIYTWIAMGY